MLTLLALMAATAGALAAGEIPIAIRWDASYSATGPAVSVARALSASAYRHRLPPWADEAPIPNFAPTQATMDAEIAAAKDAGVRWAFLHYGASGASMNAAWGLYSSSTHKGDVPSFWLVQNAEMVNATEQASIVAAMQAANWMKVGSNRPVLGAYFDGTTSDFATVKAGVDAIRAAATSAGLGNPYVIALNASWVSISALATGLGADAVSNYIGPIPTQLAQPFSTLRSSAESYWTSLLAGGVHVVPICMAGWDRRPRIDRPVDWQQSFQLPRIGHLAFFTRPTQSEFQSHLSAAVSWIAANSARDPFGLTMIYAWNEIDEGGWLLATKGDPGAILLQATKAVFNP